MATYIVIDQTGLIDNRIVLEQVADWQPPSGHSIVEETDEVMMIGGSYIGGVYTPPPNTAVLPFPPLTLSSRQFWTQLAIQGLIDESEAVDALRGDIPNDIKQFINGLPINQRFQARMFFEAPTFERHARAVGDLAACFSINDAAVNLLFQNAAAL